MAEETVKQESRHNYVRWGILTAVAAVVVVAAIFLSPIVSHIMTSASLQDQGYAMFDIPEIEEGFVPQGLEYATDPETGEKFYLLCGYYDDKSDSPVFMLNADDKGLGFGARKVTLENPDGSPCISHNGGVELDDKHMFIAMETGVMVFDRQKVMSAFLDGSSVKADSIVDYGFNDHSFVEVHDGKLYVGEFYRDDNYLTPESHHVVCPDGTQNHACIYVFDKAAKGQKTATGYSDTPCLIYSIPDMVQGMCFSGNGNMLLTSSWGLDSSCLREFSVQGAKPVSTFDGGTWKAPLVTLDSGNIVSYVNLPLFAEEIEWVNNRVVVSCEAACNKYIVGKLYKAGSVYSYNLNDLKVIMLAG